MINIKLILGDCLQKMKELPENSVDAVITDPPYGLEFMGKEWDSFREGGEIKKVDSKHWHNNVGNLPTFGNKKNVKCEDCGKWTYDYPKRKCVCGGKEKAFRKSMVAFQEFNQKWATEALRVLKPGGFMFSMGGTRTHHRLTCGIEDAGFLIRDELCWVYMTGFPKAQDLGMLIEKKLGGKGEDTGEISEAARKNLPEKDIYELGIRGWDGKIKQPILPLAKKWQGWKTPSLKPAFEPIIVAQKPCGGSITENVMKFGVGGFNIDECRIDYESEEDYKACDEKQKSFKGAKTIGTINKGKTSFLSGDILTITPQAEPFEKGRYPSNLLMQEECFGKLSKFFLIPKASKGEKEKGCDELEEKEVLRYGEFAPDKTGNSHNTTGKKPAKNANFHPTVKPVLLMEHLIKLTTKEGYTILDPFMGSGTTGIACINLNRNFIGIELDEGYFKIAEKRIEKQKEQSKLAGDWE